MKKNYALSIFLVLLISAFCAAQNPSEYLPEKPGKVILNQYSMNMADELHRNVKHVAEWFIQNAPVMTNPKGFDLWVYLQWIPDFWRCNHEFYQTGRAGRLDYT